MMFDVASVDLRRTVLGQVDSLSCFRTGAIVAARQSETRDRFVLADDSGAILLFDANRNGTVAVTNVGVSNSTPSLEPVRALAVDLVASASDDDRCIYISRGSRIERFELPAGATGARRGKVPAAAAVASAPTQLSEPLSLLRVETLGRDVRAWLAGEQVFTQLVAPGVAGGAGQPLLDALRERQFYMAPDCISDFVVVPLGSAAAAGTGSGTGSGRNASATVLACKDSALRVLVELAAADDSDAKPLFIPSVDGHPVSAVTCFGTTPRTARVVYGTARGDIAAFELSGAVVGGVLASTLWRLPNVKHRYGISCLAAVEHLFNRPSSSAQIVAGRADGSLEVYALPAGGAYNEPPRCIYETSLGEMVRGVYGGCITTAGVVEIVVTTFSGRVLSFAPQPPPPPQNKQKTDGSATASAKGPAKADDDPRIAKERAELEKLRLELEAGRARLAKKTRGRKGGLKAASSSLGGLGRKLGKMVVGKKKGTGKGGGASKEASSAGMSTSDVLERAGRTRAAAVAAEGDGDGAPPFNVECSFELDHESGAYTLSLAAPHVIDIVTLRSPIPLVLLPDVRDTLAAHSPRSRAPLGLADLVVSSTSLDKKTSAGKAARADSVGAAKLLTFRAGSAGGGARRLSIRMRTVEGQWGDVRILLACSSLSSSGAAQLFTVPIRPLSLHHPLPAGWAGCGKSDAAPAVKETGDRDEAAPELEEEEAAAAERRPHLLNKLTVTGSFSVTTMHQWVRCLIPEVSPTPPPLSPPLDTESTWMVAAPVTGRGAASMASSTAPVAELCFRSSIIGTVLRCRYRRDNAVFESDSISTVTIVREALTQFAAQRKVVIRCAYVVHPGSADDVLARVAPLFAEQVELARKCELISALAELGLKSERVNLDRGGATPMALPSYLSHECADALRHAERYERAHSRREQSSQMLHGIVSDLYVDWCAAREVRAARRIELPRLLRSFELAAVTKFFRQS